MFRGDDERLLGYGQGMALIRIGFGLYFLSQAFAKITGHWLSTADPLLNGFIGPSLKNNTAQGFYRPFLENVVQPNGLLFSQLVTLAELAVAISLILGLFTRFGGLLGAWLNLNYMLMKGLANNAGSNDRLWFLAEVVFALTAAGLVWGLDGKLAGAFASNPLTRWLAGLSLPGPEPQRTAAES